MKLKPPWRRFVREPWAATTVSKHNILSNIEICFQVDKKWDLAETKIWDFKLRHGIKILSQDYDLRSWLIGSG